MADEGDRRITAKTMLMGSGMGTTPERLAELQRRAAELDKLAKKAPAAAFASVLSQKGRAAPVARSKKDEKRDALPKKAPRQRLGTPAQRALVGQDGDTDPFIVKG
jgi:hypothetical protein